MSFKPYLVQAKLHTLVLSRVSSCVRSYNWSIQRWHTPGNKGDRTSHHGRASFMDAVTAQLTQPEALQLIALGDDKLLSLWQHPLFKPIFVRVEDLQLPAEPNIDGFFVATFNLVESRAEEFAELLAAVSVDGAKAKADSAFADLGLALDGLDDIPGTAGANLSTSWDAFGDSYSDLSGTLESVSEGDSIWRDMTRTLDAVVTSGESMISAVHGAETYLEASAQDVIQGVSVVVQTARTAVDTVVAAGGSDPVTFAINAPTDIYGLIRDAGLEATEAVISSIMAANAIEDPFAILPGVSVTMPTKVAA